MMRLVPVLVLALLGSGCSWVNAFFRGTDNAPPPAKLVDIEKPVPIDTLWEARVGSGTEGAFVKLEPAADRGRVFAASADGAVAALDADTGKEVWRVKTKLPISAGVGLGDEVVLVGASDGQVLALAREDGKEAWLVQVSSEILAPPRVADGVVVVRSVDGKFTGLDARNGAHLWVYQYPVPVLSLRGTAPPLMGQGVALAGLDSGRLVALSLRDGVPVMERVIAPPRGRTELERLVDVDAEPKAVGAILFVAAYQGNITAIDLRGGGTLWVRDDISTHAGLDADTHAVYVSDADDTVWALDVRDGRTLWKQAELGGRSLSAPVVSGQYVALGDFEGYVHWLDADTGRMVGRARAGKRGIGVPPVVRGSIFYVLDKDGSLSAFRAG